MYVLSVIIVTVLFSTAKVRAFFPLHNTIFMGYLQDCGFEGCPNRIFRIAGIVIFWLNLFFLTGGDSPEKGGQGEDAHNASRTKRSKGNTRERERPARTGLNPDGRRYAT
jgi:hypothetical protein